MAPLARPFAPLAAALVAVATLAAAPPATALDPYNLPGEVDGYDWGCGGIAPVDLFCSAGSRELVGSTLDFTIQFCAGTITTGATQVCLVGDQVFQGIVTVRIDSGTGSWTRTCTISATLPGQSCTTHYGSLYAGDVVSLTGTVQATCGACPGGLPAGYWRVAAHNE